MWKEIIARGRPDGALQSLSTHSKNVAEISLSISHYPNISKILSYLHDVGKLSVSFQNYIKKGGQRGNVTHAWQGAFLINELVTDDCIVAVLLKEIIGFCITAHHNHLNDGVAPDGTTDYFNKYSNRDASRYSFMEIKEKISNEGAAKFQTMFDNAKSEIENLLVRINKVYRSRNSANFAIGLFIKYLYSCLVDADRLDAYLFQVNKTYIAERLNWDHLIEIFETNISEFPSDHELSRIRKSISEKCKVAANRETGIYQLAVPTGGGKTLSSLRFALHHCKEFNKKRIIYVIPYLSIIEQTAKSFKDILELAKDNDVILEHHSSIIESENEASGEIRKLSASRWDSPIVITTMVQFLESVMSSRGGELRKFASMADSVIIFDEIQSIPVKTIHCFNEIVTFLSKILNSTIILCSATQPTLEATQRTNLLLHDSPNLINGTDDFKDIKRVTISPESEKDYNCATGFIIDKACANGNCLVIVNTKISALELYNRIKIKTSKYEVIHLSTLMCPVHRIERINFIRDCLKDNKKVICVSTQLIEAGVDISFSCVIRALSGLDSIAQAAGRCNRNCESNTPKIVYTFSLTEENLDKLIDIKSGKQITEQIIMDKDYDSDLLDGGKMSLFYRRYFSNKDNQMDYPTKGGEWIYNMLSGNESGKNNYKNRVGHQFPHLISHAFHSADINFSVIDTNTKSVVVIFGDAESLIARYRELPIRVVSKEKIQLIKKLQSFSVSLYEWQLKELDRQRALEMLDEETGIIILNECYYSKETGVILNAEKKDLIV